MEKESSRLGQFGSSVFIVKNEKGVFVDLSKLESPSQFMTFADRVFSSGYYFADLYYPAFLELLSGPEEGTFLRFASDIQSFPAERLTLYRQPKIFSGNAEYLFEPLQTEKMVEEPVLAENEDGETEIVRYETRTVTEKIFLSFDEFVAAMWLKGIRFGIDAAAVDEMISGGKTGRLVFAHPLPPRGGQDSSLEEKSDRLYRDNSPRELPNGKMDLRQFRNRFPQIRQGEKLLKKCPRVLGKPGMDISGSVIEPPLPEDFDLETLAGEGTRVERTSDGEFIVADMDGFLNLDTDTNRIAVTEKIVNYGGVSMKTTGDLLLDGEHFEEHGDIQEKRVVEGKSITVFGDVFGTVVSSGGLIHFKKNLVGGSATNHDGDIVVEGLASSAIMHARYGEIRLKTAENCTISGKHVVIEQAVNCTVLGETVEIDLCEGSAVAGRTISMKLAGPRKENQTLVTVLLPDLSGIRKRLAELGERMIAIDEEIGELKQKGEPISSGKEVRNYLAIVSGVQKKEISLSDEQKVNFQKLGMRVAPALKALSAINSDIQVLQKEKDELIEEGLKIEDMEKEAVRGISCNIENISRDTLVTRRKIEIAELSQLHARELRVRLLDPGTPGGRLPHDESLSWTYA